MVTEEEVGAVLNAAFLFPGTSKGAYESSMYEARLIATLIVEIQHLQQTLTAVAIRLGADLP
jgi:hypothetical protein